ATSAVSSLSLHDALPIARSRGHSRRPRRGARMTRVRVHNFTISLDGYGAGPRQTREEPLGVGGEELHDWYIPTRTFQRMGGKDRSEEHTSELQSREKLVC